MTSQMLAWLHSRSPLMIRPPRCTFLNISLRVALAVFVSGALHIQRLHAAFGCVLLILQLPADSALEPEWAQQKSLNRSAEADLRP